jgi:hypothetical protein
MYAFCQDMPGMTVQQQAMVNRYISDDALSGCVVHIVGEYDAGIRMIDVWTDEAAYRRFQTNYLWPALDRLAADTVADGALPATPGQFTVLEVTGDVLWGPAAHSAPTAS